MIFLSPVEHRLLAYSLSPGADLARDAIAEATSIRRESVGRILTRLRNSGLIEIKRGPHRRILAITTLFPFEKNKGYRVMNPQQRRFRQ